MTTTTDDLASLVAAISDGTAKHYIPITLADVLDRLHGQGYDLADLARAVRNDRETWDSR